MLRSPTADGVSVAVHDLGGDGPTVLLAHATGFNAGAWAPLAARLTDPGGPLPSHVLAVDLRGHGASAVGDEQDFAWAGFGRDVLAAVDVARAAVAPGSALFGVGHSAGAAALLLAEAGRPGTFAGLYCYEPIVMPPEDRVDRGVSPLAAGARRRRARFASLEEAEAHFSARPPLSLLHPGALRGYLEGGLVDAGDGELVLACRPEHEARVYEAAPSSGAWEALASVRCPVVVASGDQDAEAGRWAAAVAGALPDGRHRVLAGLGHFGPLQDPGAVAADVAGCLAALVGR